MRNRSPLVIMLFTIFIDLMGFGIIIPVLPNLSVALTGTSASLAVAGVYALFNFIFAPFWGSLSDRYGRRPIMLVSILLTAAANLMFGFVTAFWILIIQRALAGIGSANISVANAYVADVSSPQDRTKNMGLVGAAFGLGFIFGPLIGGIVGDKFGILGIGVFSAGLSVVNFILAYFLLPESLKEGLTPLKITLDKVFKWIKKISGVIIYLGIGVGIAFVISPIIKSLEIVTFYIWLGQLIFTLCLLAYFILSLLLYFILPKSIKAKIKLPFEIKPITQLIAGLKITIVRELLIINFVFTLAFSMMYVTVAVLWEKRFGLDELQRGYMFSFIGVTSTLVQGFLVGLLNRKFGEKKLLYAGLVFGGIGLAAIPLIPEGLFWLQLVSLLFIALANGCITPSILGLISNLVGPQEQGKMMGLNQSAASLGRVFGPVLGGVAYELNFHTPYFLGGFLCVILLFVVHDLVTKKMATKLVD